MSEKDTKKGLYDTRKVVHISIVKSVETIKSEKKKNWCIIH